MNPIIEKSDSNNASTSLVCSTPLVEIKHLEFIWYKNEQVLLKNNSDYEQVTQLPTSLSSFFSSELKFKTSSLTKLNAYYTCSLRYTEDFYSIARNESIVYRPKCNFFY